MLISPGVGKAKAPWGWGSGGLSSRSSAPPLLIQSVPEVGNLHQVTPGSSIVATVGSGAHVPHSDVAIHPEVLSPDSRDIPASNLSSLLSLSEDYQVAVQAGTALGEAGEALWDTIQLQRGDTLLMVVSQPPPWVARPLRREGWAAKRFFLTFGPPALPPPAHQHAPGPPPPP